MHSLAKSYIYVVSNISYIGAHEMNLGYQRLNLVYPSGEIVDRRGSGLMVDALDQAARVGAFTGTIYLKF